MTFAAETRTLSLIFAALCMMASPGYAGEGTLAASGRIAAAPPATNATTAILPERIVPLIRTRLWLDRAVWQAAQDAVPAHEPLFGNLFVVFAEDTGLTLHPLTRRDVTALGLGPAELRAVAVANLRRMLPAPEVRRTGGAALVITPTGYGASRILLEDFWRDPRFKVSGDAVFALATHDMIVLTGSASPEGLDTAKTVAGSLFKSYPFAISGALYTRRGEAMEPFRR